MARCAFGWPLFGYDSELYTPSLSGGSWNASLPLTNLKDRRLSKVARSSDALAASTVFDWDLGVARAIGALPALIKNITKTTTPTIRWRGSSVSDFSSTVYDSGNLQYWPSSFTAEDAGDTNIWKVIVPGSVQTARFWRCNLVDTGNADGYLDAAFAMPCGIFQPTINMNVGPQTGLEDNSIRTRTDASSFVFDEQPRLRTQRLVLEHLTAAEALGTVFKMQRKLGIAGQLLWMYDTADAYAHERSWLATMRTLSGLEEPNVDSRYATAFELVEEI